MSDPFFNFFDSDRPAIVPESSEWGVVEYKEYPRSPKISLPKPDLPAEASLGRILLRRKTERDFSDRPLDLAVLSNLFYWSMGITNQSEEKNFRRFYPSGGARFPVEAYIAIFRGEDISAGVYHYNFKEHALELLSFASAENIRNALPYDFSKEAASVILFSFIGERTTKKYGTLGYKSGMIEAGHIGQNIYLVGAALGLGVLALGGMDYEIVHKELDLDTDEESVFYQIAIGWPA